MNIDKKILELATNLSRPIEELDLSYRTCCHLRRWGITTISDVCKLMINGDIKKVRGLGEKRTYEIEHRLEIIFDKYQLDEV